MEVAQALIAMCGAASSGRASMWRSALRLARLTRDRENVTEARRRLGVISQRTNASVEMTPSVPPSRCPDCAGSMRAVQLFGRGPKNPVSGAAVDAAVVHYADGETSRSTWLEMFDVAGEVRAMMCQACGRIFLYGTPRSEKAPSLDETIACFQCGANLDGTQSRCPKCGWSYGDTPEPT